MKRFLWVSVLLTVLFPGVSGAADPPKVTSFYPQGSVKDIRQVKTRFSHPMVAFGDPRCSLSPFDVTCPVAGEGRWVDSRNWVYDFEKDLPGGIKCEFRLKKNLRSLSGDRVEGRRKFSFSTGGPAVRAIYPNDGSTHIDEEQLFLLSLDAEPDEKSLYRHVAFFIDGIENPVGIKLITGYERETILKDGEFGLIEAKGSVLILGCRQRFPPDARIRLVWGNGVMSKSMISSEREQVFSFRTRPPFTANFQCSMEKASHACSPLLPMSLRFTSPIPRDMASSVTLTSSDGRRWSSELPDDSHVYSITFRGPFPEYTDFLLQIPSVLEDDAGRRLSNSERFPLRIRTGGSPPLAKFASRFSIVESKGDKMLPVAVRNLESEVIGASVRVATAQVPVSTIKGKVERIGPSVPWGLQAALRKVAAATREKSMFSDERAVKAFRMPKATRDLEVMGIPLEDNGLYLIELESLVLGESLLASSRPAYVPAAALVTNMSVHFKWGRESSLVWVTSLDKGEAVEGAEVLVQDCTERILWEGRTDSDGLARITAVLPALNQLPSCGGHVDHRDYSQMGALSGLGEGLFVIAQTAHDMSFVHSSWDRGIEAFRFNLPEDDSSWGVTAHTVLDRTLLRAGDTVHMKHVIRRHTGRGFELFRQEDLPDNVTITHLGSGQTFESPVAWDERGCAVGLWEIPKEAKLGTYEIALSRKRAKRHSADNFLGSDVAHESRGQGEPPIRSGAFRVEEFRVPLIKTTIKTPPEPLIMPKEVTLYIGADYMAGGPAKWLSFKLRTRLRPLPIMPFDGFEGFVFSNGFIREGQEGAPDEGLGDSSEGAVLRVKEGKLDESGTAVIKIDGLKEMDSPREMLVELEYLDPNGEVQTASSQIRLWNAGMVLGLGPSSWAASGERILVKAAALDFSGRPLEGTSVSLSLFERRYLSHRKRLVGGFYSYEHKEEIRALGVWGKGVTDSNGIFSWEASSPVSGNIIVMAEACDRDGNRVYAHADIWVAKKGRWWFDAGDHDRIDLLPEKRRYEPGEIAVLQTKMPFGEALALVTVEREGIIESFVRRLTGERPVVEVPVKGSFAPNVFVSVMAVRGRIDGIQPMAMVDMGRPSYKLGIAEIKVGWSEHELKVSVVSDKEVYRVREKARVRIKAYTSDGSAPGDNAEAAVVAVDEGLLELSPNKSWDLLSAMMGRRAYEVQTATAQMEVVGRRHYGLKALPEGGGGGRQPTREFFEPLLYWNGRLPLDGKGEAEVEIPLNDSLSRFLISAVVTSGIGFFGSGQCSVLTTQDLVIIPGLPPLVREGDSFAAEFTIRNASERVIKASIYARNDLSQKSLGPATKELPAGASGVVGWKIEVPRGLSSISWEIEAVENQSRIVDRIRVSQKVLPAVPVRTFQATLERIENDLSLWVKRPPDAETGSGGILVDLRGSVSGGLEPVKEYMELYPYGCLEQLISKAVALRDEKAWHSIMARLPSYLDSEGLAKYFQSMPRGSADLTSYLLLISAEAGLEIPNPARSRMELGLKAFVEGRSSSRVSPVSYADLGLRKLSAIEALSRIGAFDMRHLSLITVEPELWPTSALLSWMNILLREKKILKRDILLKEAERILRSRLDVQGTALSFSSGRRDAIWWLMVSEDVNALRAILTLMQLEGWRQDIPRLVIGALARQKSGRWDLTVANAWGVVAMERFSNNFEKEPITGATEVAVEGRSLIINWPSSQASVVFPWGHGAQELLLKHRGKGVPWAVVRSRAAIPLAKPISNGFKVNKSITPLEQNRGGLWSKGDVLRVRLDVEAQAEQGWVVVTDPIPAGASIMGSGLGRDSRLLISGEQVKGPVRPSYEERSFEAFRAYYEYIPKGGLSLEYTIRLNHTGVFHLPATRVEALYLPEMMAEIPNPPMEIQN